MVLVLAVVGGSIIDSCVPSIFRWPWRGVWARWCAITECSERFFGASFISCVDPWYSGLDAVLCCFCCCGTAALCSLLVRAPIPRAAGSRLLVASSVFAAPSPVAPRTRFVQGGCWGEFCAPRFCVH